MNPIIKPILELTNLSSWNESILPTWPSSDTIEIKNNKDFELDLSLLKYKINLNYNDHILLNAPLNDPKSKIYGASAIFNNIVIKNKGLYGTGLTQNGIGQFDLIPSSELNLNKNWSLSFFSFIGDGECSNQYGTSIIATNNAYEPIYTNGFQLFCVGQTGNDVLLVTSLDGRSYEAPVYNYIRNSWNHIVLSYNSESDLLTIYMNGENTRTYDVNFLDGNILYSLTNYNSNNNGFGYTANTGISDLSFWNHELSIEEIKKLNDKEDPFLINNDFIINSTLNPIQVDINWGDNTKATFKYDFLSSQSENWLKDIQDWVNSIGPYRYNTNNDQNKEIIVKIQDSCNNIFGFKILLEVLSRSFYELELELEVKKSVFNSETASVVFNLESNKETSKINNKVPIISILN